MSYTPADQLGVDVPTMIQYVVRNTRTCTPEERGKVMEITEYNMFSFPSPMITVDYLSDSGSSSMTDIQWMALLRGDEAYGRNHGYYCLLDAARDMFERGDQQQNLVYDILVDRLSTEDLEKKLLIQQEGGFVNGGVFQLQRPNFFICPQGRCAENLLYSNLRKVLNIRGLKQEFYIPSNGFFDTTEGNARNNGFHPINLFSKDLFAEFPAEDLWKRNPFKGGIDLERLRQVIVEKGAENIPIILLTITNNTGAGQPVSIANMKAVEAIGKEFNIPVFFDACRCVENAYFIKEFEEGWNDKSINEILKETFTHCDGFTMSLKKDGLVNIGGILAFRDKGLFHQKFCEGNVDIGVRIKESQILQYGNDSYGGLSGRDIMAAAVGMHEVTKLSYLQTRINQIRKMAYMMAKENLPVILPAGGHAVYLDMDKLFEGIPYMGKAAFPGVGFTIELLREYGIRACELGPFAFEYDQKTDEERKGILNFVRFAVPRNQLNDSHINYTVKACKAIMEHREKVPSVEVVRGAELKLRHFQSGCKPTYHN
ncbi:hypothetical protein WA158_003690 [Blastocystis sp. Blastoise]